MKLKNKKTGEIGNLRPDGDDGRIWIWIGNMSRPEYRYASLAELNAEWEDCEGPDEVWYIDSEGNVISADIDNEWEREKAIGNYFKTKEEAEKAVEKLKAWQRLKDKGFRFEGWTIDDGLRISICTNTDSDGIYDNDRKEMKKDLDFLFGAEE